MFISVNVSTPVSYFTFENRHVPSNNVIGTRSQSRDATDLPNLGITFTGVAQVQYGSCSASARLRTGVQKPRDSDKLFIFVSL